MENQMKTLIDYRKELAEEDLYLRKIAAQIQEQISTLEVERLNLAQIVAKNKEKAVPEPVSIKVSPDRSKELNLNVPSYIHSKHNVEEEEEEDEDED